MVKKITNIAVSSTAETLELEWGNILSRKVKLLQNSDWSQLSDVNLDDSKRQEWREWRAKLRRVKRVNNLEPVQALELINTLEKSIPKHNIIVEITQPPISSKEDFENNITPQTKNVEKVFIEKQPIIIREELDDDKYRRNFYKIFDEDHTQLQSFLKNVINKIPNISIKDNDTLDILKEKTLTYLTLQQKYLLELKINVLPSIHIINEKYEQALEYLTVSSPKLENYPLIELHTQLKNISGNDVALSFLQEKKIMNQTLVDSEKFLLYNQFRISSCDDIASLKELIIEIKNGY